MAKMIIDNCVKGLADVDALYLAGRVVDMGRISNDGKQYCHATMVAFKNKCVVNYCTHEYGGFLVAIYCDFYFQRKNGFLT
jgi:hypothetical protein